MAETLETAAPWSGLMGLYAAVARRDLRSALEGRGTPGLVMCHISHLYPDGASLYFTFIARAGAGRRRWSSGGRSSPPPATRSSPTAARSPITTRSAATTSPWMPREIGSTGVDALRGVKERLDPAGILNPGKLLP